MIGFNKIEFVALNKKNVILLSKKILVNDFSLGESFETLVNFLDQNIIEIEKQLKDYINDIYLIVNYNNFITVDMSPTYNFKNYVNQPDNISNSLVNIKNNLIKDMTNYDLTHMMINKFIVDRKYYHSMPSHDDYKDIFFELRFIFLQNDIKKNLKSIFSKYQILIKKILCYEYVNTFNSPKKDNIFNLAYKLSNGFNEKEFLFINKSLKNKGFFEKFFSLFN